MTSIMTLTDGVALDAGSSRGIRLNSLDLSEVGIVFDASDITDDEVDGNSEELKMEIVDVDDDEIEVSGFNFSAFGCVQSSSSNRARFLSTDSLAAALQRLPQGNRERFLSEEFALLPISIEDYQAPELFTAEPAAPAPVVAAASSSSATDFTPTPEVLARIQQLKSLPFGGKIPRKQRWDSSWRWEESPRLAILQNGEQKKIFLKFFGARKMSLKFQRRMNATKAKIASAISGEPKVTKKGRPKLNRDAPVKTESFASENGQTRVKVEGAANTLSSTSVALAEAKSTVVGSHEQKLTSDSTTSTPKSIKLESSSTTITSNETSSVKLGPKLSKPVVLRAKGAATTSPNPSSSLQSLMSVPPRSQIVGRYSPEERLERIRRFLEKRKQRVWMKTVKYGCRKKLADSRPRVKGRFVPRALQNQVLAEQQSSPKVKIIDSGLEQRRKVSISGNMPAQLDLSLQTTPKQRGPKKKDSQTLSPWAAKSSYYKEAKGTPGAPVSNGRKGPRGPYKKRNKAKPELKSESNVPVTYTSPVESASTISPAPKVADNVEGNS